MESETHCKTYAIILLHQFGQHIVKLAPAVTKRRAGWFRFGHWKVLDLRQINRIEQHIGHVDFGQTENEKNVLEIIDRH